MSTTSLEKPQKKMVDLERVVYYKWTEYDGKLLRALRGKTTREQLSAKITELGGECSVVYLGKLESGRAQSISVKLAIVICQALNIKPESLLDIKS